MSNHVFTWFVLRPCSGLADKWDSAALSLSLLGGSAVLVVPPFQNLLRGEGIRLPLLRALWKGWILLAYESRRRGHGAWLNFHSKPTDSLFAVDPTGRSANLGWLSKQTRLLKWTEAWTVVLQWFECCDAFVGFFPLSSLVATLICNIKLVDNIGSSQLTSSPSSPLGKKAKTVCLFGFFMFTIHVHFEDALA